MNNPVSRQDRSGNWWIAVRNIDEKDWARGSRYLVPFRDTYKANFFERYELLG